jgi:hypothetical protein
MENADTEEVTLDMTEAERAPHREPEPAKVEQAAIAQAEADPAAQAFARLEGEMALMRRAVQHLAAERADIVIPDYGATLGEMSKRFGAISGTLDNIAEHPAMQLTPDSFGKRIEAAAEAARRSDQGRINDAHIERRQAAQDMRSVTVNARTNAEQRQSVLQAVGGGMFAGILLWSFLPGTIARAMPESWHWPERMAARIIGETSRWDAGARLMRGDSPEAWSALVQAADLLRDNRDALDACRKSTARLRQPVRCTVEIRAENEPRN